MTSERQFRRHRSETRHLARFGWGPVDQLLSSASNFALSVVAGRVLGPAGLGIVFVGFAGYLISLGFQRALVLQPLVVTSAGLGIDERRSVTGQATTACAVGAVASSVIALVAGLLIPGDVGRGLRLFAPWIGPAILQDLWRAVLFRDGRGTSAASNDAAWVLTMALTMPLVLWLRSEWAVVSWWGIGGLVGAALGFVQVKVRPHRLRAAWTWWRAGASLSGWLFLESAVVYAGAQGAVLILAPVLGSNDLGGLRAAEALFVPMSFLKPAIELPGLALMSGAERPGRELNALAAKMSAAAVTVTLLYLLAMAVAGGQILERLFGGAFARFDTLIVPFGAGQVCAAVAVGFTVLLKGQRRGRALVAAGAVGAVVALTLSPFLGVVSGVRGAAWGLAVASAVASVATVATAARRRSPRDRP
jgi:O-antigen/teichoic acid export membrane protein